jgi:uncharacterized membrane protein
VPALGVVLVGAMALRRVGYPGWLAGLLAALVVLGGRWDVTFWPRRPGRGRTSIGLNVGGAVVPLGIAIERSASLPGPARWSLALAVAVVGALSLGLARVAPGRGIVLAWPLTGLLAGALALALNPSPDRAPAFAFAAAVLGPFLGAELPNLPALAGLGAGRAAIGGGGGFDGLVWSALLAALVGVPGKVG